MFQYVEESPGEGQSLQDKSQTVADCMVKQEEGNRNVKFPLVRCQVVQYTRVKLKNFYKQQVNESLLQDQDHRNQWE